MEQRSERTTHNATRGYGVLGVMSIVRDEGWDIGDWLHFHKSIGIRKFFLIDNQCNDDTIEVARKVVEHDDLTVYEWEGEGGQKEAYKECFECSNMQGIDWLFVIDADEYIVSHQKEAINETLDRIGNTAGLILHWRNMGSCGHVVRPRGTICESFTRHASFGHSLNRWVKMAVRPSAVHSFGVHTHAVDGVVRRADGNRTDLACPKRDEVCGAISLFHYSIKSLAHFERKATRGNVLRPFRIPRYADFVERDTNDEYTRDACSIAKSTDIRTQACSPPANERNASGEIRANARAKIGKLIIKRNWVSALTECFDFLEMFGVEDAYEVAHWLRAFPPIHRKSLYERLKNYSNELEEGLRIFAINRMWDEFQVVENENLHKRKRFLNRHRALILDCVGKKEQDRITRIILS